jgi:hypothetical protein
MKRIITLLLCAALCPVLAAGAYASGEASDNGRKSLPVIVIGSSAAAEEASGEMPDADAPGEASGELPLEAMGVVEFGGEEYVLLDDLILSLLLGNR